MPASHAVSSSRIVSIDIFRGLTMAVMIFVNQLAGVHGLPWWTYHAHAEQDAMTYVDMVFPFFLFIVGMAMPLAIGQRLRRNPSVAALWGHIFTRALALLALGLILANADYVNAPLTHVSGNVWALIGILSAALYLNVYPKSMPQAAVRVLRIAGLAGVALVFALFRRVTHAGTIAWIETAYPEILGLIACTYFAAALLYIPTRRWQWAAPAWLIVMTAYCAGSVAHVIPLAGYVPIYVWPFDNGAHVMLVLAGVVTSQIFLGMNPYAPERPAPGRATAVALGFAAIMFTAGWLLMPLGISKIRATPAWALWSAGAAVLAFTLLYWICDRWRATDWTWLVRSAGSNTLLTYLLPDLWDFALGALGIRFFETHWNRGLPGVAATVIFTVLLLLLSTALTRAKLRLQL
ncbi:MAG TPA: DUF5009 domain-containing protein [Terracidiphilus sp.]|nr:DUF5009 domain-containing protein [Terracidiphilus sp.]